MALFYAPLIYVLLYYFSDLPLPTLMLSTPIRVLMEKLNLFHDFFFKSYGIIWFVRNSFSGHYRFTTNKDNEGLRICKYPEYCLFSTSY